jgi:hypothetical protein
VEPAPLSVAVTDEPPPEDAEPVEVLLLPSLLPQAARPVARTQAAKVVGRIRDFTWAPNFVVARQADAATTTSCYRGVVEL